MSNWCKKGCVSGVGRLLAVMSLLWVSLMACHAQLDKSFRFVAREVCQWNNPTNLDVFEDGYSEEYSRSLSNDYVSKELNVVVKTDAASYVACPGEHLEIVVSMTDDCSIQWYDESLNHIHTGHSFSVTKDDSETQYLYVRPYIGNTPAGNFISVPILLSTYCGDTLNQYCEGDTLFVQDFSGNDVSDPWISPTDFVGGHSDLAFSGTSTASGHYCLAKKCPESWAVNPNYDHTCLGDPDRGYFMYLDPAPNQMNATLYEMNIDGLYENVNLEFSFWVTDLQRNYAHPAFEMQLVNPYNGEILIRSAVVDVPRNNPLVWHHYGFPFTLPAGLNAVRFRIINKNANNIGNDWAIDDIHILCCGDCFADPCVNDTTLLYDTITYGLHYQENGFNIPCNENTPIGLSRYEQLLSNASGCDSLLLLDLVVLCPESNHSNVITPSIQDGINDYFMPFGERNTLFADIEIFNRWGKRV